MDIERPRNITGEIESLPRRKFLTGIAATGAVATIGFPVGFFDFLVTDGSIRKRVWENVQAEHKLPTNDKITRSQRILGAKKPSELVNSQKPEVQQAVQVIGEVKKAVVVYSERVKKEHRENQRSRLDFALMVVGALGIPIATISYDLSLDEKEKKQG